MSAQRRILTGLPLNFRPKIARNFRLGISEILVWTDSKAVWAVSFYKRQGYAEIEPTTRYGDPIVDARIKRHGHDLAVLHKHLT